ncbi:MAG: hypothetical protein NC548_41450 [Lachnospiraceae bacterium]|nr:hypothetical protein [Lachnospiraceae bacterium]
MPKTYKVVHEDHNGNQYLYGSDATISAFDPTNEKSMAATNLQDAVHEVNEKAEGKAMTATLDTTIRASAFTGKTAPYIQTITLEGVLETDTPLIGAVYDASTDLALRQQEAFSCIAKIETRNNQLVVYCFEDKPTVDIPIQVKIVR